MSILKHSLSRSAAIGLSAISFSMFAAPAQSNLVVNGGFETIPAGTPSSYQLTAGPISNLPDWQTTSGYTFLVFPGTATYVGSGGNYKPGLWTFPTSSTLPGVSGNFLIADGGYAVGTLTQQLSGLTIGATYTLTFYQAAGQQYGSTGTTTESWQVTQGGTLIGNVGGTLIGNSVMPLANTPSHGDQDWNLVTMTFVAGAVNDVLGFLAVGTPINIPPMVALDCVDVVKGTVAEVGNCGSSVPEPATVTWFGVAMLGLLAVRRRQKHLS